MMEAYDYDKDEIKNSLDITQIADIISELGGEPRIQNEIILSKTICHGGDSHKLYYYDNTKLFRCYTGCAEPTFDIFELVRKVKERENQSEYSLPQAIDFVATYFGFSKKSFDSSEDSFVLKDYFSSLANYERIADIELENQRVELKTYDGNFLKNYPRPRILPWIQDGISDEVMKQRGICYDPKNYGIIIPHYDIDNRLIGIRERTLIKENEIFGKYRPAKINGKLYNHPLSFNLYNINNSKDNIKKIKKAFVFEGEKSCMQYATMFGMENDISVAVCGSSFIQYQCWLLINLGVREIVVGLDKQYKELGDNEHKKLVRNLKQIHRKYGHFVTISYLFDKGDLIGYKSSPTDEGKEKFLELYKNRVNLY